VNAFLSPPAASAFSASVSKLRNASAAGFKISKIGVKGFDPPIKLEPEDDEAAAASNKLGSIAACPPSKTNPLSVEKA